MGKAIYTNLVKNRNTSSFDSIFLTRLGSWNIISVYDYLVKSFYDAFAEQFLVFLILKKKEKKSKQQQSKHTNF